MRKALITGGAGFIGTNLASRLIDNKWKVAIFDNLSRAGTSENLKWLSATYKTKRLEFTRGDVRDFKAVKSAIGGFDIIFHLAAQVAVTTSFLNPREDFEVNAIGTFNVLEAVRERSKKPIIIFASTNKVYGELSDMKVVETSTRYQNVEKTRGVDETWPLDFHSPYACSNGAADQYVHDYFRMYAIPTVVFRQSCIYGKYQLAMSDQGWVAYLAMQALAGKPITIFGNGKQVRDILYVDDLVDAYLASVALIKKSQGEIYNIGGGINNSVSLLEYIDILERKLGSKIKVKFAKPRPGDQKIFISNNSKVSRELSWRPKVSKEKGIGLTLDWIKNSKRF